MGYGQAMTTTRRRAGRATGSARQESLRASNLSLVARTVAAAAEPPSRADISAATGMTRSTATRLADELVALGVLAELPARAQEGPGRPSVPLTTSRGAFVALGMEVNVAHLTVRAVDLAGRVIAEHVATEDLSRSDPAEVLARLDSLVRSVASVDAVAAARLVGAGLALPGLVRDGLLLHAPNLGWHDVRPADHLLSLPEPVRAELLVGNEASLAALTAARLRPGRPSEHRNLLYLSGEVGIGAGIVRDGEVVGGADGFAGEIGHVQVDPAGPECQCGNRGCLERYAGRSAIMATAGFPAEEPTRTLVRALHSGDARARQALEQAEAALAVALGAALNILDVPVVVLGGQLADLTPALGTGLEQRLRHRVLAAPWAPPTVEQAPEDEAPGATGAAWALLERILDDPLAWTR